MKGIEALFPKAHDGWIDALIDGLGTSSIDAPQEIASFCAQLYQESAGLTRFEENLYYSTPERLVQIFPHRFAIPDVNGVLPGGKRNAYEYVRNPEKLANYVYNDANRGEKYKLGNDKDGDGWKYRGMGPIQITGKKNYFLCGDSIGVDLVNNPELLKHPEAGIRSAIWFWSAHDLDRCDDDLDVKAETRIVTGGESGLRERQDFMTKALHILGVM